MRQTEEERRKGTCVLSDLEELWDAVGLKEVPDALAEIHCDHDVL